MTSRAGLGSLVLAALAAAAAAGEEHRIEVELSPETSELAATDRITVTGASAFDFQLSGGLEISSCKVNGDARSPEPVEDSGPGRRWSIRLAETEKAAPVTIDLSYAGKIAEAVKKSEDLSFVVGDDTTGVICPDGVYLSKESLWYPVTGAMARFDVKVKIPEPFVAVTQGTHADPAGYWTGKYEADGLSLCAGKWKHEERKTASGVVVGTYLTEANAASAKLLIDATEGYLRKYAEVLGPYAYDRFDVVENWFTTGYGMPEFTLLGRDVIARMVAESQRLGSIPNGYLDHEIVHSWWGNLVFPDFEKGNWCEGLTSYCSNYLSQEWVGADAARDYRRRTSVRYTIGVTPDRDYPVRAFVTKTEDRDNDIGYGKCAMVFHALRRDLGDDAFWGTLRRVARERRGSRLTWDDWQREFEAASKRNLAAFFAQALDRTGAPLFAVAQTSVGADAGRLRVAGTLVQVGPEGAEPWRVTVPVVVEHLTGREEFLVDCASEKTQFSVIVPSLPLRVTVDPDFHVFRRLADDEVPPCLAAALAQPSKLIVYPDGDEPMKAAAEMAAARSGCEAVPASKAPATLARGRSYVVFGDAERVPLLASVAKSLPRHFPGPRAKETASVLATSRSPVDATQFVSTLVGPPAAAGKRARAVFYYQYDGRIAFDGAVPKERSQSPTANHATRTLLPDVKASASPGAVRALVDRLAAPEMNGRLAGGPEEKKVRAAIVEEFTLAGLPVDEQAFSFGVKEFDHASFDVALESPKPQGPDKPAPSGAAEGEKLAVDGLESLVASPPTNGRIAVAGLATEPEAELSGRAFLVDLPADAVEPLATLRAAADLVKSRAAVALVVRLSAEPSKTIKDLMEFPKDGVPAYRAAGTAARTGSDRELSLPTVVVRHGFDPAKHAPTSLDIGFRTRTVSSANVVARVKSLNKSKRPGVVVLGAHYDHLGAGFPGADDDASGVAALTEAGRILSAHADLLGRDVVLVAFGAEEWGLRGSKAFLDAWPKDQPIVAMINADTVGRRGVQDVSVVGVSKYPRLAQVVGAALEQSNLDVGRDIDQYAFAWGSDHWSFHEAGIPAVDLWSGDYAVMHTAADTADGVDEAKISRIGRALALAALGVAGGF